MRISFRREMDFVLVFCLNAGQEQEGYTTRNVQRKRREGLKGGIEVFLKQKEKKIEQGDLDKEKEASAPFISVVRFWI